MIELSPFSKRRTRKKSFATFDRKVVGLSKKINYPKHFPGRLLTFFAMALFILGTLTLAATLTQWGGDTNNTNNLTLELNFTHLTVNDSSLLLYFPFDRNNTLPGNLTYDYSNYSYDGRYQFPAFNSKIFWNASNSPFGGHYVFRNVLNGFGDDTIINVTDFTGNRTLTNREFTVSFWYRYDEPLGRQNDLLGFWRSSTAGNNGTWCIQMGADGQMQFAPRTNNGSGQLFGSSSMITTGRWYNYAVVVNSSAANVRQYINGTLTATNGMIIDNYNNNSLNLKIGSCSSGVSQMWNGTIDEVRIWNRSLTNTEVSALFNNQSNTFLRAGEAIYRNLNVSQSPAPSYMNITVNTTSIYLGLANISLNVGYNTSAGVYLYGPAMQASAGTNNFLNVPIYGNTPQNMSLKFTFYSNGTYSPYLENFFVNSFGTQDATPLGVTINDPTEGESFLTTDSLIPVEVKTTDVAILVYFLLDGDNSTNYTMVDGVSGIDWGYNITNNLSVGTHNIRVIAEDIFGNRNDSEQRNFLIATPDGSLEEACSDLNQQILNNIPLFGVLLAVILLGAVIAVLTGFIDLEDIITFDSLPAVFMSFVATTLLIIVGIFAISALGSC